METVESPGSAENNRFAETQTDVLDTSDKLDDNPEADFAQLNFENTDTPWKDTKLDAEAEDFECAFQSQGGENSGEDSGIEDAAVEDFEIAVVGKNSERQLIHEEVIQDDCRLQDTDNLSSEMQSLQNESDRLQESKNYLLGKYEELITKGLIVTDNSSEQNQITMNRFAQQFDKDAREYELTTNRTDDYIADKENAIYELINSNDSEQIDSQHIEELKDLGKVEALRNALDTDSINCKKIRDNLLDNISDEYKGYSFESSTGKDFSETYKNLIQEQGQEVANFEGTCGLCTLANLMNQNGDSITETDIVNRAISLNRCYKDGLPEDNGGTTPYDQVKILESFGYVSDIQIDPTFEDIVRNIENGNGVKISVHAKHLESDSVAAPRFPFLKDPTDHAVMVTGMEKDLNGTVRGIWLNDTGQHGGSNMTFITRHKFDAMMKATKNPNIVVVHY